MEPDVLRLYSSSPPPLDDGGAEDEDDEFGEFGEFGGFGHGAGAMAASFSFSDMDTTPPAVAFNQSHACDTAPPELPVGLASAAPGPQKSSLVGRAPGSSTSTSDPSQQVDDQAQPEHEGGSTKSGSTGTTETLSSAHNNGGVGVPASLVNGFPETSDTQDDSLSPPTTSALSSPSSSSYNSPCVQRRSEDETETETEYYDATSQHNNNINSSSSNVTSGPPGFNGLSNGCTVLHSHTKETRRDGDSHGDGDGDGDGEEVSSAEEQEVLSLDEDLETRDQETSVQRPQSLSDSTLHTEASVTTQGGIERPVTLFSSSSTASQEGTVSDHHQGSGCDEEDIRPAENKEEEEEEEDHQDLPTPSGPTQTSESDDFASFCDVVSPSDDFGDFGHFGSTEAPPASSSAAVTATSEGPSIVPPDDHGDGDGDGDADDDDDFGGFGEAGALSAQGFADFSQTEHCTREEKEEEEEEGEGFTRFPVQFPPCSSSSIVPSNAASEASAGDQSLPGGGTSSLETGEGETEEDGGSCPQREVEELEEQQFGQLPVSDSFADFQSVPVGGGADDGEDWAAFGEPEGVAGGMLGGQAGGGGGGGGENWAAFGDEQQTHMGKEEEEEEEEEEEAQWQDVATATPPTYASPHTSRRESLTVPLSCRLQRLFQASFPPVAAPQGVQQDGEEIPTLQALLETQQQQQQQPADPGAPPDPNPADQQSHQPPSAAAHREPGDMWRHLQDIHGGLGLKFLWGGSYSNRQLLRCLAVDTRNIVFAGQKKQPVIVPAFATGLGMLEPTKDPVNPTSAAGPVAASAQVPPGSPSRPSKEAVSSVQPDWSSSGLKPPADVQTEFPNLPPTPECMSGLELNLDFFGPVKEEEEEGDSSSGCSTPPAGVDPELYELTTGPMEPSSTGKNIADAFTRLMSTMEQNSTSTRRPAKEESVGEEAARVLSVLPDLSFMRAKVLMFPSVLTPLQPPDAAS